MREDIKINQNVAAISEALVEKLELIMDIDIGIDIYNLGLIYEIHLDDQGHCDFYMTFTSASCSCIDLFPPEIEKTLTQLPEIKSVQVHQVWSPVWKMTRISRFGRVALGINPN